MLKLRLAASAVVTVLLLALCAILVGPAFELPASAPQNGIGAGGLPQFTVIAVAILAPVMFVQDLLRFRRTAAGVPADEGSGEARRVVILGTTVLVLLAGFVFLWQLVSFLPAATLFTLTLCCILMPAEVRSVRGYAVAAIFSLLFCTGVWALFVHLLAVPLR